MCSLCWEEKTEEIAKKNGAKKWKNRKDALLSCFAHQDKFEITKELPVNCDICEQYSNTVFGKWHCNRKNNKDVCPSCVNTEQGQDFISQVDGWTQTNYKKTSNSDFASFLNWIVLLRDKDTNDALLYNINKNSPQYHRVVLVAVDDHSREGYFVVPGSLEENLAKLQTTKIKDILSGLNHETHFG